MGGWQDYQVDGQQDCGTGRWQEHERGGWQDYETGGWQVYETTTTTIPCENPGTEVSFFVEVPSVAKKNRENVSVVGHDFRMTFLS